MSPASPEPPSAAAPAGGAATTAPDVPVSPLNPAGPATIGIRGVAGAGQPLFAAAEVDSTTRVPVLLFFGSAILWLLLASILSAVGSFKLVLPGVLTNVPYLTVGRVVPAAQNAFVYGWAASAAIGAGLWILARLCRAPIRDGGVLLAAWLLWNLGLTLGLLGILRGDSTGFRLLEFPMYASPVLFSAYVFIAIWAVLMFRYRRPGPLYISHWFLVAAFLWFPWAYATANLLLFFMPVQAAAQAVIHSWYLRSFGGVWFTLMALGAAYYIVPKVMGRPVHRYGLATIVFWGVIVFFSWSGAYFLIGGPVPAWMLSLSIVGGVLLLVPAFIAYNNLSGTLQERTLALRHSPSLRFTMVGVSCFLASTILGALIGLRSVNAVAHFTTIMDAQDQLAMYGFVSMVLFGAVYYIVPRLLELEWPSPSLIRAHFWFSAVGVGLVIISLFLGGVVQGLGLADAKVPFETLTDFLRPLLVSSAVCGLAMLAGHVCFAASWALIFYKVAVGEFETRRALRFSEGDPHAHHVVPRAGDFTGVAAAAPSAS